MNFNKLLFLTLVICIMGVGIVNGQINLTVSNVGDSFITWNWSTNETLYVISIDGVTVCNFDYNATSFTLSGLGANELHSIAITGGITSVTNKTLTSDKVLTNQEDFFAQILPYLAFIIAIVFIIIGLYVDFIGIIGSIIALWNLVNAATNGSFIMDVIWVIIMLVGLMSCSSVFGWGDS